MNDERNPKRENEKQRPSPPVRPEDNPGPRGNPEIERDSLERGKEKLERVKPY